MSEVELRFNIGAYTPKTIPMERLGQYMADLGAMLGEPSEVHFVRLEPGSTNIVHKVKEEALPKVVERVGRVRRGEGELVHLNAFRALNKRLKEDNGTGRLVIKGQRAPLLLFPGRDTPAPQLPEPVVQTGSLDGQLIAIGGRDATVPARLQDGDAIYRLTTTRAVARQLGPHLYGGTIRVLGEGKWLRSDEGVWTLDIFKVLSFIALDDRPLLDVVEALRRIPNEYTREAWDELLEVRDDGESAT
jgi:hypothetical protein